MDLQEMSRSGTSVGQLPLPAGTLIAGRGEIITTVTSPSVPPEKSVDRRGVETIISGVASAIPFVGGLLSSGIQQGLAAGQEKLLRQFLIEFAEAHDRYLIRLGHVELDAFLARREAAAAINQGCQIALGTPSREKHQLLARAVLNAATSDSDDSLVPIFWTLVGKHSPLEVRLLAALDDPINRAIDCGYGDDIRRSIENGEGPVLAECLFAVVPELRHPYLRVDEEVDLSDVGDRHDSDQDEEDALEEVDVSGSPDPGWLFQRLIGRLDADGLLDADRQDEYSSGRMLVEDSDHILEVKLSIGDADDSGHYPGKPYGDSSYLGARYLAFLADEPEWPIRNDQP